MIEWKDPKKELPQFDTVISQTLLLLTRFPGSSEINPQLGNAINYGEKITFTFKGMWENLENGIAEEVIAWTEINLPE